MMETEYDLIKEVDKKPLYGYSVILSSWQHKEQKIQLIRAIFAS